MHADVVIAGSSTKWGKKSRQGSNLAYRPGYCSFFKTDFTMLFDWVSIVFDKLLTVGNFVSVVFEYKTEISKISILSDFWPQTPRYFTKLGSEGVQW